MSSGTGFPSVKFIGKMPMPQAHNFRRPSDFSKRILFPSKRTAERCLRVVILRD
jgi:hypothetical protein